MSKKFKINDQVRIKATGEIGVLKGRETIPTGEGKKIKIEYIVKLGEGFDNWKCFSRKEIENVPKEIEEPHVYTKIYDVVDNWKITLYAKVYNEPLISPQKARVLCVGYSIYSPEDEYNERIGIRIAKHRAMYTPFCSMVSSFYGEFNKETVEAIMDAKANYIKNNFPHFINRAKKTEE